jgi:putative two-component system response regulator
MAKILVVDDRQDDRYLLATLLASRGHEILEAGNGEEALRIAHQSHPSLVITDVMMPVMDGFELCSRMREDAELKDVPLMFYSATYTRTEEKDFARAVGGNTYVQKPAEPARLIQAAESLLARQAGSTEHLPAKEFWEQHRVILLRKLEQKVNELEQANTDLRASGFGLRKAMTAMVETISRMVEYRDPYTAGHERRVGTMAAAIGREMGLEPRRVEGLLYGGHVHDVGKICAPAEILTRPGRLNDMELAIVRAHSRVGHDILQGIEFPWPVALMALQHHERYDGSGYPDGIKGEAILLESRILAVADVVEAMATHRPYRAGLGIEAALAEIEAGAGTLYDPNVAAACLRMFREQGYRLPE